MRVSMTVYLLTETCDDEVPHLITDVQTTPALVLDFDMLGDFSLPIST